MGSPDVRLEEGDPMETLGTVLSISLVALGPVSTEVFPAVSVTAPAGIEIATVPVPVMLDRVTVRVKPEPETPIELTDTFPVL